MSRPVDHSSAVDKKRPKAFEREPSDLRAMSRQPRPSLDTSAPPGKRQKGDSKGAVVRAPSGSKGAQKGAVIRAASAHSSGKGKGQAKGVGKGKIDLDDLHRAPLDLVPNRNALVDRSDGVSIRRNPNVDFRLAERPVRVESVPPRRDAPRHPYHDRQGQSSNTQYSEWMESAWVGRHPDPPAGSRDHEGNDGAWDDYHSGENARNRGGTWHYPRHPLDLRSRARSRTPNVEKGKGKGHYVETRIYAHDDNGRRWRVVDREHEEFWDNQNEMSQFRRNVEYQRDRAAGARYNLNDLD